jgi:hypothetical protein
MTTPVASLADELRHELLQARAQLVEARFHQAEKDTLEARAAVARSLSFIDAVLDMYLATSAPERNVHASLGSPMHPLILRAADPCDTGGPSSEDRDGHRHGHRRGPAQ